jgi:flagellar operon protein
MAGDHGLAGGNDEEVRIPGALAEPPEQPEVAAKSGNDPVFKQVFSEQLAGERGVTFSKHASERLFSRGIEMSPERLAQIGDAIDKAEAKGSRETLILTDDTALVVSVKNRTVITAFDKQNLRDGIVTSIDSAVIL